MKYTLYAGSYTTYPPADGTNPTGLHVLSLDSESGHLDHVQSLDAGPNPAFIALHPNGQWLYTANELSEGYACAFAIEPVSGRPALINQAPVDGADPCFLTVDPSGRWLLAACYSSGNLSVLPIDDDGRLGGLAWRVQHIGRGPNTDRQDKAHAHCVRFAPGDRFALAADLGMDRVWVYRFDQDTGRLDPNDPPGFDGIPGAGPRHLAFHPNGRFVYIANELASSVTACAWDPEAGALQRLQTLAALPDGFHGENTAADIHLTPNGMYLYVSNRGMDSLAAFRVDAETGALENSGFFSCGGNWPRNFAIDPQGRYLLAANQFSNNVAVLRIEDNGALEATGEGIEIPAPVCLRFV